MCVGGVSSLPSEAGWLLPGEYCPVGLCWGGAWGLTCLSRYGEGWYFRISILSQIPSWTVVYQRAGPPGPPSPWPEPAPACPACSGRPAHATLAARLQGETGPIASSPSGLTDDGRLLLQLKRTPAHTLPPTQSRRTRPFILASKSV